MDDRMPLEPAQVRRLLQITFPTDSDLDAFCLDYFPQVKRRFTNGMDRVSKTNLLFEMVPQVEILNRLLHAAAPEQVNAFLADEALSKIKPRRDLPAGDRVVGLFKLAGQRPLFIRGPEHVPTVWCSYAGKDQPFMQELETHLAGLEQQGVLQNVQAAVSDQFDEELQIVQADVIVFLLSPDYLATPAAMRHIEAALRHHKESGAAVMSVLLRPALWEATPLASVAPPLLEGRAVSTAPDRDAVWLEVVGAIRRAILFPSSSHRLMPEAEFPTAPAARPRPIEEIFAHSGRPDVTYVETEQSREMQRRLRNMGEGLVVEGPSGVGKTTAVLRALDELEKRGQTTYLLGTDPEDLTRLDEVVKKSLPAGGYLVVDDFHRLDPQRQAALALLIKRLSDRNRRDAKVTLIGINPVGATLVRDLPEMQRYSVIQMRGQQSAEEIDQLISRGEQAAHIEFRRRADFIAASEGSFAIAQRLCYEAALKAGVTETATQRTIIDISPTEVLKKVHQDLAYRYRALLLAFAACAKVPPPCGACLLLLWHLWRSNTNSVVVQEVKYQYQHVTELNQAFQWILESNLARLLFDCNPGLRRLLFYNSAAGVLSAEDPHLWFYLRHLDWLEFARASGHALSGWDLEKGPIFPTNGSPPGTSGEIMPVLTSPSVVAPRVAALLPFVIVHLSDLHFSRPDQAARWRSQLAEDIRRELRLDRVDAVVLSGDIANHAEETEYQAALDFVRGLTKEFSLLPHQMIPVPGNHDVNWRRSENAYTPLVRKTYAGELREGAYFAESADSRYIEVRDERKYKRRFEPFAAFYQEVRREPYPLEPAQQALVYHFSESQVLFLSLNSAWQIDHHFKGRSDIHAGALSSALDEIRTTPQYEQSQLKIAVFHHPVGGADEARIRKADFLERLAQAGFRVVLHGHVHEAGDAEFRYYRSLSGLEILGAGTFGAAGPERPEGIPLQYQVIEIEHDRMRVRSRRRIKEDGAWEPDHRYRQAPGEPNLETAEIPL